jgi:hypothetical protein
MFAAAALFASAFGSPERSPEVLATAPLSQSAQDAEAKLRAAVSDLAMDANPRQLRLAAALTLQRERQPAAPGVVAGAPASPADEHAAALERIRATVADLSDVTGLASPEGDARFRESFADATLGIRISARSVPPFPVDLVKAVFYVPCAPRAFLALLEFDHRRRWDSIFVGGTLLHRAVADAPGVERDFTIKLMRYDAFPGLLRPREFEVAVHTEYDTASHVALVKAVSTPFAFASPPSPGAVRGFLPLSGFVARPVPVDGAVVAEIERAAARDAGFAADAAAHAAGTQLSTTTGSPLREHTMLTYVALVHPRGNVPVRLLNLVVGKQTASMRRLQMLALAVGRRAELAPAAARAAGGAASQPTTSSKI